MAITPDALIKKFKYALDNNWGYVYGTAGIKWTKAKQDAATREATVKYGSRWIGHYVADCSGLFSWAFKELGGYMYHGSNTMYRSYCTAKGKLNNGMRADGYYLQPGTAIFTGTESDHGHVGLFVGNGKVIEAKGTQYGVVESKITDKKWTYWGELKGVEYEDSGNYVPHPTLPTLKKGDKGQYVKDLQTKLIAKGFSCGSTGADGDFGTNTEKAVKAFQKAVGLAVDGIVGPDTWRALEGPAEPILTYKVTITGLTKAEADALKAKYPGATVASA